MLKKLIKYDLKDLFSITWIFYLLILTTSILLFIFNQYELDKKYMYLNGIYGVIGLSLIILLILLLGFVIYKIENRFNKNIYSDEGYLTNTLPISQSKLYFSKILSSIIFLFSSEAIITISYSIGLAYIFTKFSCFNNLGNACSLSLIESLIQDYSYLLNINPILVLILFLLFIFFEVLMIILSGYNGIIKNYLNNTPKKIKSVIYSILFYLLSSLVILFIIYIVSKINPDISKVLSMKPSEINNNIIIYKKAIKTIFSIVLLSSIGINILLIFNGNRLFNKGINLE